MEKRIKNFEDMKVGMFVHFGLYSIVGKGEWFMNNEQVPASEYEKLMQKFNVGKNWAKNLVKCAKHLGAKYIVLTTRHHDGFSLYNTLGLSEYDVTHTPTKRDLVKEFVYECNKANIVPFFYCTLIDWHDERFKTNFNEYIDYLFKSVKLLCTNYGKIGGFWFDGTWCKGDYNWPLDELYKIIRTHQPGAIIANNGGLENRGEIINKEIDCIVFERDNPTQVNQPDKKHRAKEMCQVLNDHWGYHKTDKNYKTVKHLYDDFVACLNNKANFLLNVGPKGNGNIQLREKRMLKRLGKKIKNTLN